MNITSLLFLVSAVLLMDTDAFTPPAFARRKAVAVGKWARPELPPKAFGAAAIQTLRPTALFAVVYMPDGSVIHEDDYGVAHVPEERTFLDYLNGPDLRGPLAVLAAARKNIEITTIQHVKVASVTESSIDIEAICAADDVSCVNVLASINFTIPCETFNETEIINNLNILHQQATVVLEQQEAERQKQKELASRVLVSDEESRAESEAVTATDETGSIEAVAAEAVEAVSTANATGAVGITVNATTAIDNVTMSVEAAIEKVKSKTTIEAKTSENVTANVNDELPETKSAVAGENATTALAEEEEEEEEATTPPEAVATTNKTTLETEVTLSAKDTTVSEPETTPSSVKTTDNATMTTAEAATNETASVDEALTDDIPSWWIPASEDLVDEYDILMNIINEELFQKDLQQLVIRHAPESVKAVPPKHVSIADMGQAGFIVEASMPKTKLKVPIKFSSAAKNLETLNNAILDMLVQDSEGDKARSKGTKRPKLSKRTTTKEK